MIIHSRAIARKRLTVREGLPIIRRYHDQNYRPIAEHLLCDLLTFTRPYHRSSPP